MAGDLPGRNADALLRVGVLALQGDFVAHARALAAAGAEPIEVRTPDRLAGLHGLALPGGESTAWLRLMAPIGMPEAIREFHGRGGAIFGTCAGLILLAREVVNPQQESLGLLDVTVQRNGYGRQIDSFVAAGTLALPGRGPEPVEMVFIRAPRIVRVGPGVRVLGRCGEEPVLVGQGRVLASAFHPEMSPQPPGGSPVLRHFLETVREAARDLEAEGVRPPGSEAIAAPGSVSIRQGESIGRGRRRGDAPAGGIA